MKSERGSDSENADVGAGLSKQRPLLFALGRTFAISPALVRGVDIPLVARLFTVVDVFDALMSKRPYEEPVLIDEALEALLDVRIIARRKPGLSVWNVAMRITPM